MTNFIKKIKTQLERFNQKKFETELLEITKTENPDYCVGLNCFEKIVFSDSLKNIVEVEEQKEMEKEMKEIRKNIFISKEVFGCQSYENGNLFLKTSGINSKEMKELLPLKSLYLFKESTENSFSFLNNPSTEGTDVVVLFDTAFPRNSANLEVCHWGIKAEEFETFISKDISKKDDFYKKLKDVLQTSSMCFSDLEIRNLYAEHSQTFEKVYNILNETKENDITLNEKNATMIISVLERFGSAISDKVDILMAQAEKNNDEIKKKFEDSKKRKDKLKQDEFEKILELESELQYKYLSTIKI